MNPNKIKELYKVLKTSRSRFGIWCCALSCLGEEPNIAVQIGAEAIDLSSLYLQNLDPDADFIGLNKGTLTDLISDIASKPGKEKILVYNIDLLLAKMDIRERSDFWDILESGIIYKPRSLVIMVPSTAPMLSPIGEALEIWKEKEKLISEE